MLWAFPHASGQPRWSAWDNIGKAPSGKSVLLYIKMFTDVNENFGATEEEGTLVIWG
jgi:hypothetical protein